MWKMKQQINVTEQNCESMQYDLNDRDREVNRLKMAHASLQSDFDEYKSSVDYT